jgi:hypothetical protein
MTFFLVSSEVKSFVLIEEINMELQGTRFADLTMNIYTLAYGTTFYYAGLGIIPGTMSLI